LTQAADIIISYIGNTDMDWGKLVLINRAASRIGMASLGGATITVNPQNFPFIILFQNPLTKLIAKASHL
jgi:hypothetical protein